MTGFGADLDQVVGRRDHGFVVFHHDDGITRVGKAANDGDEAINIAGVQTYARFIEHEQGVDESRAEA